MNLRGKNHSNILNLITDAVNSKSGNVFTAQEILDFILNKGETVTLATIKKHLNHRTTVIYENTLIKVGKNFKKS